MDEPGLRERKKARTRAELQRHALLLFRDRGYAETTVDDIAAAAEVSRSTFFRYFATKEDVVLFDDVDPLMVEAFLAQAEGTPLMEALRSALRAGFDRLDPEKRELEEVRMELARSVPALEAALRERNRFGVGQIAEQVADAVGRDGADEDLLLFAGAFVGARLAAQEIVRRDPTRGYVDTLDRALARLGEGIPLATEPIRHS